MALWRANGCKMTFEDDVYLLMDGLLAGLVQLVEVGETFTKQSHELFGVRCEDGVARYLR